VAEGDRRRFAREPCLLTVHLRVGKQIYEGTLVNISENGGFLATRRPVEPGTQVQVRFRHPWTDRSVTARAMVMRQIRPGERGGPEAGLGLALLDSLSALEDDVGATTTGSFPRLSDEEIAKLRSQAEVMSGAHQTIEPPPRPSPRPNSGPAPSPASSPDGKPMRQARHASPPHKVFFHAAGRRDSIGTLTNISAGGMQVKCSDPPDVGRLVRLEIVEGDGRANLRVAGKITWSNTLPDADRPIGFGVRILHFISATDERRFASFLIEVKQRAAGL
jgi:hypothetical protein